MPKKNPINKCNHEELRMEVWRVIFFDPFSNSIQKNIDAMIGKRVCCSECCDHLVITDEWLHKMGGA